jgi:hypothetical protein
MPDRLSIRTASQLAADCAIRLLARESAPGRPTVQQLTEHLVEAGAVQAALLRLLASSTTEVDDRPHPDLRWQLATSLGHTARAVGHLAAALRVHADTSEVHPDKGVADSLYFARTAMELGDLGLRGWLTRSAAAERAAAAARAARRQLVQARLRPQLGGETRPPTGRGR